MKLFRGFSLDLYEKRPQQQRTKPMRLLILGLSRTGTATLFVALRKLGLNPYHFAEVVKNKDNGHFQLWLEAVRAKYDGLADPFEGSRDFDRMLWDYDAVTDSPCCLFVEELVAAYPEAKVILPTRDRDAWFESMRTTVLELASWRSWTILAALDRDFSAPYWSLFDRTVSVWSRGLPPWRPSSRPAILRSFDEHGALVRDTVPEERLLEFHPSQGWGPLCEFLEVPVPEGDFPHVNDGKFYMQHHARLYWSRWRRVAQNMIGIMGVAALAVAIAWRVAKHA